MITLDSRVFSPSILATSPAAPELPTAVKFGTAGLGGILAWCVVHPANTVAVRMNLAAMSGAAEKQPNFYNFAANLYKTEGTKGLYAGLEAGIIRQIFYATSRFGLFEVFRDKLAQYRKIDVLSRLLVGCASGGVASLIACPAEVTLVRLSNDASLPVDQRRNYKGFFDAATRISSEEGFGAFYRGCYPLVTRAMLVGATQVGTFDQFKATYRDMGITGKFSNVFAAAMSSGLLYSVITMPFESAKNRMAFQKAGPDGKLPYTSTLGTIGSVASKEGPMALYNGFGPYYLRCGGHSVLMFLAISLLRDTYANAMK